MDGTLVIVYRVISSCSLLYMFSFILSFMTCELICRKLAIGSSKVTEFLLSKGIPVDIDFNGRGTPLMSATNGDNDNTLKILLGHHANVCILLSYILYLLLNLKHACFLLQQVSQDNVKMAVSLAYSNHYIIQ